MTRSLPSLTVACALLAPVSACFKDPGPNANDETAGSSTGLTAGETGGGPSDPAIIQLCNADYERRGKIAESQCQCQVDQGMYTDVAACLTMTNSAVVVDACTCDVHGQFPDVKARLECTAPAQTTLLECLTGVTCTPDNAAFTMCQNAYVAAISTCGTPTEALLAEIAITCDMVPAFACGDGKEVPETWKCNLEADCADASDETTCPGVFTCEDGDGFIPANAKCNTFPDCDDESDEGDDCPKFTCANGVVIPLPFYCDGFPDCCEDQPADCMDDSDEATCATFMCTNGTSIPEAYHCDGIPDDCCMGDPACTDGSDESPCTFFMCANGMTIADKYKCDGFPQCYDGSDELDCPP